MSAPDRKTTHDHLLVTTQPKATSAPRTTRAISAAIARAVFCIARGT
jgi:hypothetical protein